jgi:hypothetical protein
MSKLRADITYNHRLHNDSLFTESTIDINDTNQNSDNPNNLEHINDPADNSVLTEADPGFEELDKEADEFQLENEFAEYLQNWVEMLEEEKNAEFNDFDENDNNTLENITHPAIDVNAKWELENLFKDNINLPF